MSKDNRNYHFARKDNFFCLLKSLVRQLVFKQKKIRLLRAVSHLKISMCGQRPTGKIQRNNYHQGNYRPSFNG